MKKSICKLLISVLIVLLVPMLMYFIIHFFILHDYNEEQSNENNNSSSTHSFVYEKSDFMLTAEKITIISSFALIGIIALVHTQRIVFVPKGEYEHDTEGVIDAITAEAIIDGKIDAKDLIMTCITSAVHKKNLEYSDKDERITLLSTDGLTNEEYVILHLLYVYCSNEGYADRLERYGGMSVYFSNLKKMFENNNETTLSFYEGLKQVKNTIKEDLIKHHIVSKIWSIILCYLRALAIILLVNTLLIVGSSPRISWFLEEYMYYIFFFEMVYFILNPLANDSIELVRKKKGYRDRRAAFYGLMFLIIFLVAFVSSGYLHVIKTIAVLLLNFLSVSLSNTLVYTKTGKIELKRAIKLKRYIIDYSLMKDRDVNDTIIWDEYLVYATAFGIPSKITSKIAESLMNINISLQIFNSIFSFL